MSELFRKRLLEEMKANGFTTKKLAELVGVSPEMITQYYTTKKLPSLETFANICKALNVSADYLLGLSEI
ncbi:MAG: helix-turn-helix domain-containing protein [Corallococcus sp.]|nr:helix-turn-helix domain-containing protein [Corallococcus sp.]MCM1359407.1 helix-turn-helix domain-containing protein [Corallococcus sp.]MCM1394850.1 helix-turn-helix domain-containing protein [Corallococcus sp.]